MLFATRCEYDQDFFVPAAECGIAGFKHFRYFMRLTNRHNRDPKQEFKREKLTSEAFYLKVLARPRCDGSNASHHICATASYAWRSADTIGSCPRSQVRRTIGSCPRSAHASCLGRHHHVHHRHHVLHKTSVVGAGFLQCGSSAKRPQSRIHRHANACVLLPMRPTRLRGSLANTLPNLPACEATFGIAT